MSYAITCCSTADLTREHFAARGVPFLHFHFILDGKQYDDDLGESMSFETFYKLMAEGASPTTAQPNVAEFTAFFEPFLAAGQDVLHVSLSSGLSGAYSAASVAAAELSDLDEDGLFAWQEFRAGTRPDDPLSLLAFETIALDGTGGPAVLRWRSASNRFYNIWRSTNLMADFGRRLATRLPAELPVNAYTDAVEGVETRFYWIEVDP